MTVVPTDDRDVERHVEEAHCADCGKPMPSIPGWYAGVRVKFSCDTCRQRSPRAAAAPVAEPEERRSVAAEADAEPLDEEEAEVEVDDVDLEIEDPEVADSGDE
jgi:hypothetical protein